MADILGTRTADNTLYIISGSAWVAFGTQPPGSTLAAAVWGGPNNTIWCHNGQADPPAGGNPAKYLFYNGSTWSEYEAPRTDTIAASLYPAVIAGSIDGSKAYAGISSGGFEGAIHRWNGTAWSEALVGQRVGSICCDETGQYVWGTNAGGLTWSGSPTVYYSDDFGATFNDIWSSIISDLGAGWGSLVKPRTSGVWCVSATEVYLGFGWDTSGPPGYNRGTVIVKWDGVSWSQVKITAGMGFGLGSATWSDGSDYVVAGSYSPMEVWQSAGAGALAEVLPLATGELYQYAIGRGIEEDDGSLYLTLPGTSGQTARTKVSADNGATWPTSISHPWGASTSGIDCLARANYVVQLAPTVQNQDPDPDSTGKAEDQSVYLEIVDTNDDLDISTVIITIDGEVAWTSDAPANGWSGHKLAVAGGYYYKLFPHDYYDAGAHSVRVQADDLLSNSLDETYSFSTDPPTVGLCGRRQWGSFQWGQTQWGEVIDCLPNIATPTHISTLGGETITIGGIFPTDETLTVHLGPLGSILDPLCYGGEGLGYEALSRDGTTLQVVAPPAPKGTSKITVVSTAEVLVGTGPIVVERNWPGKLHQARKSFPQWSGLGGRRLGLETEQ